jgi:hypothetical protein
MAPFHALLDTEVGSVKTITADLGVGGRQLIVTSGIVLWNWVLRDGHTHNEVAVVWLNVFGRNLEAASAFVALASIANEDTGFTVATDTAKVDIDQSTGELYLTVNAALSGDSALNRFSYQVVATIVSLDSSIYGTITWSPDLYVPNPQDAATVGDQLSVMANRYELVAATPGVIAGVPESESDVEHLSPDTSGRIETFVFDGKECVATYRITNPHKAMDLKVTVSVLPSFAGGQSVQANRIAGPEVFTLTVQQPDVEVDFEIVQSDIIK